MLAVAFVLQVGLPYYNRLISLNFGWRSVSGKTCRAEFCGICMRFSTSRLWEVEGGRWASWAFTLFSIFILILFTAFDNFPSFPPPFLVGRKGYWFCAEMNAKSVESRWTLCPVGSGWVELSWANQERQTTVNVTVQLCLSVCLTIGQSPTTLRFRPLQ